MKYFGWIFLFFIMLYIVPLGSRPMLAPDEFRYAEIPREMINNGDYTTPRLCGVRYFEKTPMNYWLTAGSFKLFGQNAFANRLPSALAVGLTALFIALLIQQALRDEKLAALAAMLYLSSALVFGVGTTALVDSVFTMFVTGTQGLVLLALHETKFSKRKFALLALSGIFIGAAFLTKGFLAFVIPALTITAFLLIRKRWKEFLLLPLPMLIFAALTILPWGLAIHRAESDFWHYFVFVEHLHRATAGEAAQHSSPWWYYLPILPLGLLPGALLLPSACAIGKKAWQNIISQDLYLYALCALVVPFIFLSAVDGKLATYILPCIPPAVLLIAAGIQAYFNAGGQHRVYNSVLNVWGGFLLAAGICSIAAWFFRSRIPQDTLDTVPVNPLILITAGITFAISGGLMLYSLHGNWRSRIYLFFFGLMLLPLGISWNITSYRQMPEATLKSFFNEHEINLKKACIVTSYRFSHATAWVSGRQDIKLLNLSEFEYGNEAAKRNGEPQVQITDDELIKAIKNPARDYDIIIIMKENDKRFNRYPMPPKRTVRNGMECAVYPEAIRK
ncbi:MAG: phospholipid carrier-dependent glycosyltransferase [Lentisphaeria bacterium]|nr:phospholipid carrier-dependent glycosyltransferase [Lentisphaeria bacterium]